MIASKHIGVIVITLVVIALAAVTAAAMFSDKLTDADDGVDMEYESELFDTSDIISINIIMDEDDWNDLLENAIDEEYYPCDVVINGTTFSDVGIRAKGNTSLSSVYNDDTTQRYSLKIEFDHYIDGQTCWGLDKLVLNNNYADATSMKEAVTYDMFAFLGADASLYNYASISVNGDYWGCYLALEAVEESFVLRNYGTDYGELYKPENMGVGGAGAMKNVDSADLKDMMDEMEGNDASEDDTADTSADTSTDTTSTDASADTNAPAQGGNLTPPTEGKTTTPQTDTGGAASTAPSGNGGNMARGGGMSSGNGADLNYIDDDADSYSTIWDGEVFDTTESDHERVVKALKNISEGSGLEEYMDVDNMLKYLAVQTFVVNLDGLAGTMAHNYYLYEDDGRLNLLPWDYNLAFGGFQSSSASTIINFPIDTPFTSGINDREFFAELLENDEYLAQYHEYLRELAEEYVGGGRLDATITRIRSQIDTLVATDPTAFYTEDEYTAAVEMLEDVVRLRAESVRGQLDGTIPSTTDGQSADSSALIDCSDITLSVMGSMGGNGGGGGQMSAFPGGADTSPGTNQDTPGAGGGSGGDRQGPGGGQNGGAPSGKPPDGTKSSGS